MMDFSPLSDEQSASLQAEREWVEGIVLNRGIGEPLGGSVADLPSLQALLEIGAFSAEDQAELAAIGTAFGDVLADEIGLHWVLVSDEYGKDIALKFQDKHVFVFPRDMLIKRVERGEASDSIDLSFILAEVKKAVLDQAKGAKSDAP